MPTAVFASWRLALVFTLALTLFGCTITETIENFLSSTSPSDYTQDGLPKAEQKVNIFVALNLDNLKADLARGEGEYLTSLGTLLQVPPQHETEFFALAQQRYLSLEHGDRHAVSHTLIALSRDLGTAPHSRE